MASEIKYLSYDGLDYFWKNKLKPLILENEQVTATALTDLNDRINTHTHTQYAPTSHVHSNYLQLSGGAMTGTITSRNIIPAANSYNLGTANNKWSEVYAGRFYGELSGLASCTRLVQVNPMSANSYYPVVFSQSIATSTIANTPLGVDSSTNYFTNTAVGIRYNPGLHTCYCSGGFYEMSDERLKNFGDNIEVDLDKLSQLSKKYFTWKDDESNVQQIGISAQEIQKLYPELVNAIDEDGHLSVSYDKLSVIALKGIDILNNELKSLEERITKLEKIIDTK